MVMVKLRLSNLSARSRIGIIWPEVWKGKRRTWVVAMLPSSELKFGEELLGKYRFSTEYNYSA